MLNIFEIRDLFKVKEKKDFLPVSHIWLCKSSSPGLQDGGEDNAYMLSKYWLFTGYVRASLKFKIIRAHMNFFTMAFRTLHNFKLLKTQNQTD